MLYQIKNGTVSLGGKEILSHVDFEVKGTEKIALIGKNGVGKTTLLRLIAGELELDRDDKRVGKGIFLSRNLTIGFLRQQAFADLDRTVEQELEDACPSFDGFTQERYHYEAEYDRLFTGFGFNKADKGRKLREFSGGSQTKIAMIRLFLQKPDLLLLDEPTNHLDVQTVEWLEGYLRQYDRAVVMVSHDRFFLDRTVAVVYELEGRTLVRYPGNYTWFRREKAQDGRRREKAFEQQQGEIKRLEDLIERFKHKPNKAAFARAKRKQLERIERIQMPGSEVPGGKAPGGKGAGSKAPGGKGAGSKVPGGKGAGGKASGGRAPMAAGEIVPEVLGSKLVVVAEHAVIGYDQALAELSLRIRRGQKIGIIGPNGVGKTAFLKTVAGELVPLKGKLALGNQIVPGYFEQLPGDLDSKKTVLQDFCEEFPSLAEKEIRSILGRYLFGGAEAAKPIRALSGGEQGRLKLAKLLQHRPNLLLLDEPTNHMDIQAREALETALQAYTGTMLFVSHDRYFINEVAEAILIFEGQEVLYYPFGYQHYLARRGRSDSGLAPAAQVRAEEQALVDGLRAVPSAERHRLRELPVEDAWLDWQLRLVGERMENDRRQAEQCFDRLEAAEMESLRVAVDGLLRLATDREKGPPGPAAGGEMGRMGSAVDREIVKRKAEYETICAAWTESCVVWYDLQKQAGGIDIG